MNFSSDEKLKAFLKNESKRLGISITNTYTTYFSRLLLERISKLRYKELYVKGSFSLITHLNQMIRPVTDIDLVSTSYHNHPLIALYQAMYDSNDELYYELTDIPKQTNTGIYKIHIIAIFGKIKHPISIDFQELSRTIYERDYERVEPIFKGDNSFYIYTPSFEEHFAEKLCIAIESNKEEVLNTRVKDFYDIYRLNEGKFDKDRLLYFFFRMLKDRGKTDVNNLSCDFLNDEYIKRHLSMWDSMSKKYEFLDKSIKFEEAVYLTKDILEEQIKNKDKAKSLKIRLR